MATSTAPVLVGGERTLLLRDALMSAPALVAAMALAVALLTTNALPVGVFYDDGQYLILAKALATGEGYRYLNIPGHPAATHFPPGYPVLLALLWRLWPSFPENVALFRLANTVLFALGTAGWTHFATTKLRLPAAAAVGGVLGFALAIPVMLTTNVLFSERLFFALLWPAVAVSERAVSAHERSYRSAFGAGLLWGLLALVRTVGIAGGATVLLFVMKRRWRDAALCALGLLVCLVPWQLWTAAHAGEIPSALAASYGSYSGLVAETYRAGGLPFFASVLGKNLQELVRPMPALFSPFNWLPVRLALLVPVGVVLVMGLRRAWHATPALVGFLGAYLAIVIVWPFAPDRFVWAIWPLVGAIVSTGVIAALTTRPRSGVGRWLRGALLGGLAIALTGNLRYNAYGYAKGWYDSAQRSAAESARPLVLWVMQNTKPGDVIATDADPLLYLYTGRQAVPNVGWTLAEYLVPREVAPRRAETRAILDRYRPAYLLVTAPGAPAALGVQAMMDARPPELMLLGVLPGGGAVFRPVER